MVKVRFDIVVVAFLTFLLVILGNAFVNINKDFFESQGADAYMIGYSANKDTLAVTTIEQLAMATEMGYPFALVVDSDKVKPTDYYWQLNGAKEVKKMPRFMVWYNRALGGNYYDRVYVVELKDGQMVPVVMFDGVVDLSKDVAVLPIGEAKFLTEKKDFLEDLDKKYDFAETAAAQWYVNASGEELTLLGAFGEKAGGLKTINWTIVVVIVVLYSVASTVYFSKKRSRDSEE